LKFKTTFVKTFVSVKRLDVMIINGVRQKIHLTLIILIKCG